MKIGMIGGGAIAQFLLQTDVNIQSVLVRDLDKYQFLKEQYEVELYSEVEKFLKSNIDLVVEAANIEAVKEYLPKVITKKDAIIISIGAFSDEAFLKEMEKKAKTYHKNIYLPSGAIGGIDLLENAHALNGVDEVKITTRKPAETLIDENITKEKVVFSGSAKEAINQFPKNINVSIVLSLAGLGVDETKVNIIADPHITKNEHTIEIKGTFGTSTITVTNEPMKENPKTSYLAALSVLGTIKRLANPIKIG